jgi:hypothetical protein
LRIKTGDYEIKFYDRYGAKVKTTRKASASSYTSAILKGRKFIGIHGLNSFRVDRLIYNSLDKRGFF